MNTNTSTRDLNVFESGDGGELFVSSNDLTLTESLYQTIYIALFGGNVEASTLGNEIESEERFDWWANSLLFSESTSKQFNSETERTLDNIVINTSGRIVIQRAVEADLFFLKKIANTEVNVVILDVNKISINIVLTSILNQTEKKFQFIWDNAKNQIITETTI